MRLVARGPPRRGGAPLKRRSQCSRFFRAFGLEHELGRYGRRITGSSAARQRNVTSIVSVSMSLFSLSSKLLLLFRTNSCLERRAHCWFAAERAASLADAVPPC